MFGTQSAPLRQGNTTGTLIIYSTQLPQISIVQGGSQFHSPAPVDVDPVDLNQVCGQPVAAARLGRHVQLSPKASLQEDRVQHEACQEQDGELAGVAKGMRGEPQGPDVFGVICRRAFRFGLAEYRPQLRPGPGIQQHQ